jgi:hypothetical protein
MARGGSAKVRRARVGNLSRVVVLGLVSYQHLLPGSRTARRKAADGPQVLPRLFGKRSPGRSRWVMPTARESVFLFELAHSRPRQLGARMESRQVYLALLIEGLWGKELKPKSGERCRTVSHDVSGPRLEPPRPGVAERL